MLKAACPFLASLDLVKGNDTGKVAPRPARSGACGAARAPGSLRAGAAHIPDGPAVPVDPATERVTYWCGGCGAELLLLVRGAAVAPRHCGERMTERREVPGAARR